MKRLWIMMVLMLGVLGAIPAGAQDALVVTDVTPRNGATVETDARIIVFFNRPVVALVTSADADSLPVPLTITPALTGQGEWINTATYQFIPADGLEGGVTYTLTIGAGGLTALDGAQLAQPITQQFAASVPVLDAFTPDSEAFNVALDTAVQVRFTQKINRASAEARFVLTPTADRNATVSGTFEWSDDSKGFMFRPDENLALNTRYAWGFMPDQENINAFNLGTEDGFVYFTTVPLPAIVATDPFDGAVIAPEEASVEIFFSSPMNAETLDALVTISPTPEVPFNGYFSSYNNSYNIGFDADAQTTYTVTVAAGAQDAYGNEIEAPFSFSFTTSDFAPSLNLRTPGVSGLYNANRADSGFYVTHRNIDSFNTQIYAVRLVNYIDYLINNTYQSGVSFYDPSGDTFLREIQTPSVAPTNKWRFDFVSLNNATGTTTCSGSLPTRLQVGDNVRVITAPDPLRARALPVDGEILDLLYQDYATTILDAGQCANDLLWYKILLRDGREAYVAESDLVEYFLEPSDLTTTPVPLAMDGTPLKMGIYYAQVGYGDSGYQGQFMVVANANLTMKAALDEVVVWATDLDTGVPLVNVPLTIYDDTGAAVGSASTDAAGVARIATPAVSQLYLPRVAVLDDGTYYGFATTFWTDGLNPYEFDIYGDFYPSQTRMYLYTDRPIYRSGDEVYYRGIVRNQDNARYPLADVGQVNVTAFDYNGNELANVAVDVDSYGMFNGVFTLADDVPLGLINVNANVTVPNREYPEGTSAYITVAEYRVPEFTVTATTDTMDVLENDPIRVQVDSRYFFGGAVSDADVSYTVTASQTSFNYTGDGYYSFVDDTDSTQEFDPYYGDAAYNYGEVIATGNLTTDASGSVTIETPATDLNNPGTKHFTVEATVSDSSGFPISGRVDVTVHPSTVYVGIAPSSYVVTAGEEAALNLITVGWDSAATADQAVSVAVYQREWYSVQEQDVNGATLWKTDVQDTLVQDDLTATTGADGKTTVIFTPAKPGTYRVVATLTDSAGVQVTSAAYLWVSGTEYVSWGQESNKRIDVIADLPTYAVGDTAKVLITSPYQTPVTALVTVERGTTFSYELVTLATNSTIYEVPITEAYAPNVFVGVFIVKAVDDTTAVADYRAGYTQLIVNPERQRVNLTIEKDVDSAQPAQAITYTITATDYKGDPLVTQIGVAMVDKAILSLVTDPTPDIFARFYSRSGLGVVTSASLTINADLLTQEINDIYKGGGGGGGGGGGVFDLRSDLLATAYWNPALVTDADGKVSFSVTLPDNLTTWQLSAYANTESVDGNLLVGSQTDDVQVTRPIIIRPTTPRFFVVGDTATLGALVNNNTETDQTLDVTLDLLGATLDAAPTQTIMVPANGRASVAWAVTIPQTSSLTATFSASNADYSDATISSVSIDDLGTLPVYSYEVPEFVGTSGILATPGTTTETILLPDSGQGTLVVRVDFSLAGSILKTLDAIKVYDFDCIECLISGFLPNVVAYQALITSGLATDVQQQALEQNISLAIQKLIAQRLPDNGWGWSGGDQSDVLTTAYVLVGLQAAQDAGFGVEQTLIDDGVSFINGHLATLSTSADDWQLDREAFVLYALALTDSPDVGRMSALYDQNARLSRYAQALLAQAFFMTNTDDVRAADIADMLASSAIVSATGVHWEEETRDFYNWNTDTRTTAIVLQTLLKISPDSPLLPNAVRWLIANRQGDLWRTSQEAVWSVWALADWMNTTGELDPLYAYSLLVNGTQAVAGEVSPEGVLAGAEVTLSAADDLLRGAANTLEFVRDEGQGSLYYTAQLQAYLPVAEVQALESGIYISREYVKPGTDEVITSALVGDLIEVHLTVLAPNGLPYAVIEDPLPAGTEVVDTNLLTSAQATTAPQASVDASRGWGYWYISNAELRDEKLVLSTAYLPAGTLEYVYTIRATVPGVYNVIPATAREFYFPDVYGRTGGSTFTVTARSE